MAVAELLLQKKAVRVSVTPPFRWTSGILSPVYCDNRVMTGYVSEREEIVDELVRKIQSLPWKAEVIAGTATAGIAWAALVAAKMRLPMVYIRPEPKAHGSKKQIEGFLPENSAVVLVEDLISTGGSSLKSAQAIREEGRSTVSGVLSIMTWELPIAEQNFTEAKLPVASLTGFSEIIPLAAERGDISKEDVEKILQFRKDPEVWAENFSGTF